MTSSPGSTVRLHFVAEAGAPARRGLPPATPIAGWQPEARALLDTMRRASRQARCGRHMSLSDAHRYLACPGAASGAAEALVRTLGEVLERRPVFYAPGACVASFDETWLMRCRMAQRDGDIDSLALLVGRRVAGPLRRPFLDLLRALPAE